MSENITARELAREIATTQDVDETSALHAVETFLDQIESIDSIEIDHEEIPPDHADEVRTAFAASAEAGHVATLDDLAELRDKLDALTPLQDERAHLVRKALAEGARVVDIVQASGLTRGRIYQIRDGR